MINTSNLPSTTGVYIFKKGGVVLYVGKSVNIKARVKSHIENAKIDPKESRIIENSDTVDYYVTDSEFKALLLEADLIQKYHPKYNVIWKDNKSYLYIKITVKDTYPKIHLVRKPRNNEMLRGKYFGPFSSVRTASMLLKEVRKLVPFCTQKNISGRPCFYSKIGLCNPCPNSIESGESSIENKNNMKRQYRRNIQTVIRILNGNVKGVLESFYKKLKLLSKTHQFEEAILLRNKILRFEELLYRQSFDDGSYRYNQSEEAQSSLRKLIHPYFPKLHSLKRIECYDISNTSQKNATASMVVLKNGLIDKPDYRKFRVRNTKLRSDFEMIDEILRRRFKRAWKKPDLLVIDGGKPQVRTVLKVLKSLHIFLPVIGLAKNPDRLIVGVNTLPTINFLMNNKGINLLRLIRDESHRFARKYHLFLRDRNFLISPFAFKRGGNT